MTNANNTPAALTATQTAWLAAHGIESWTVPASYGCQAGRVFVKGEFSLCSYRGTKWDLEVQDHSEDGEGSIHLGKFDTLRDALKALVEAR